MNRTIIDCISMLSEATRLASEVAQSANYGDNYAQVAEQHALDVSAKITATIKTLKEVIKRQNEVHDCC